MTDEISKADGFWWVRLHDHVRLPWGGHCTIARVFEERGHPGERQVIVLGADDHDGAAWYTDVESAGEVIAQWGTEVVISAAETA